MVLLMERVAREQMQRCRKKVEYEMEARLDEGIFLYFLICLLPPLIISHTKNPSPLNWEEKITPPPPPPPPPPLPLPPLLDCIL